MLGDLNGMLGVTLPTQGKWTFHVELQIVGIIFAGVF